MRFIDLDDMVLLLPAEKAVENTATEKVKLLLSRVNQDGNRLKVLTESGALLTAQVNKEGRAVAVFWYRKELDRLIVDTLISVSNVPSLDDTIEAMLILTKELNCKTLECATSRAGLVKELKSKGFYAGGILLRKDI